MSFGSLGWTKDDLLRIVRAMEEKKESETKL
jgi:hypothetical protein